MAVALLEKIGHAFLKKGPPHLPFCKSHLIYTVLVESHVHRIIVAAPYIARAPGRCHRHRSHRETHAPGAHQRRGARGPRGLVHPRARRRAVWSEPVALGKDSSSRSSAAAFRSSGTSAASGFFFFFFSSFLSLSLLTFCSQPGDQRVDRGSAAHAPRR